MNPTDAARAWHADEPIPPLRHGDPRVYVVASIADPTAPTAAELAAGTEITAAFEPLEAPPLGDCPECGHVPHPGTACTAGWGNRYVRDAGCRCVRR